MPLQLVDKEDCSSIENRGTRKLDRRDTYRLMVERKLRREEFKSKIKSEYVDREHPNVYIDPKLGLVQIKKSTYSKKTRRWIFQFNKNDDKNFDYLICHCLDENGNIERKYVIPTYDIKKYYIIISKPLTKKENRYDKYRVDINTTLIEKT